MQEPAPYRQGGPTWAYALAFWTVFAGTRLYGVVRGTAGLFGNDDQMRLVQIRDLLAGQGWYDLTQYRLAPPGTVMHWTRHIDALVAGPMLLLGDSAERWAPLLLPVGLAFGLFLAVGAVGRHFGGKAGMMGGLLLLLASVFVAAQFNAGRIDHHGIQIVLLLTAVVGVLRLEDVRWALWGGVAAGASLSIGLELIVSVGALVATVGVIGAIGGRAVTPSVARFMAGMVGGALMSAVAFAPPTRLLGAACDVLSLPYAIGLLVAAAGMFGSTFAATRARRLGILIGTGGLAVLALLTVGPSCKAGPYAGVDQTLQRVWLSNVSEAQGLLSLLRNELPLGLAILVPGMLATAYVTWRLVRGGLSWWRILPVLVLSYGVAFVQIRGGSAAMAVSAAVLGVGVEEVRRRMEHWWIGGRVLVTAVVVFVVSGLGPLFVGALASDAQPGGDRAACGDEVEALTAVPPALLLSPLDLGPRILLETDHSVLAAPYHRNNDGNLAALKTFIDPPSQARLSALNVDLVVICEGMPENGLLTNEGSDGLLATLLDGETPPFLKELDLGTTRLRAYEVVR